MIGQSVRENTVIKDAVGCLMMISCCCCWWWCCDG